MATGFLLKATLLRARQKTAEELRPAQQTPGPSGPGKQEKLPRAARGGAREEHHAGGLFFDLGVGYMCALLVKIHHVADQPEVVCSIAIRFTGKTTCLSFPICKLGRVNTSLKRLLPIARQDDRVCAIAEGWGLPSLNTNEFRSLKAGGITH